MVEEYDPLPSADRILDDRRRDYCLARTGRGDEEDPPQAGLDGRVDTGDNTRLVIVQISMTLDHVGRLLRALRAAFCIRSTGQSGQAVAYHAAASSPSLFPAFGAIVRLKVRK